MTDQVEYGESSGLASAAELGIEILSRLAAKGELDPWDVDIVEVMDRCLADLDATDRHDLRLCGRALHCATILLRLKADAMAAALDEALAPPATFEDDDWVDLGATDGADDELPRPSSQILDLALVRRTGLRQPRRRRVTLSELIAELKQLDLDAPEAPRANAIRRARAAEIRARTVGLAHDEDVEGDAKALLEHLAARLQAEPELPFARLAAEDFEPRRLFLALMFLAHWGAVSLEQPSFYGPITIRSAAAAVTTDEREAAA